MTDLSGFGKVRYIGTYIGALDDDVVENVTCEKKLRLGHPAAGT